MPKMWTPLLGNSSFEDDDWIGSSTLWSKKCTLTASVPAPNVKFWLRAWYYSQGLNHLLWRGVRNEMRITVLSAWNLFCPDRLALQRYVLRWRSFPDLTVEGRGYSRSAWRLHKMSADSKSQKLEKAVRIAVAPVIKNYTKTRRLDRKKRIWCRRVKVRLQYVLYNKHIINNTVNYNNYKHYSQSEITSGGSPKGQRGTELSMLYRPPRGCRPPDFRWHPLIWPNPDPL